MYHFLPVPQFHVCRVKHNPVVGEVLFRLFVVPGPVGGFHLRSIRCPPVPRLPVVQVQEHIIELLTQ